jgi:hypothetical protein
MLAYTRNANESKLMFVQEQTRAELDRMLQAKEQATITTRERNDGLPSLNDNVRCEAWPSLTRRDGISVHDQGRFRRPANVHKWMYDRSSLANALKIVEITPATRFEAAECHIPQWSSFTMDTHTDGSTHRPDSLFMEETCS